MRHVYPSREIPHLWAHQSQDNARNATGNLYFNGPTIYSYGSHFPIARIVTNGYGAKLVLFTARSYSNTTAKHMNHVRRALPVYMRCIVVAHVENSWDRDDAQSAALNLRAIVSDVADTLDKASRARSNREYLLGAAAQRADDARYLAQFFGLPEPQFPTLTLEGAKEIAAARSAVRLEEMRQRKLADAARLADLRESLGQWQRGEIIARSGLANLEHAYLRVSGDGTEVQTTQGARFPVEHARKLWPILAALYAKGQTYQRNGHSIHLGTYVLDSVLKDGTVIAGCHRIERAEVERFAGVLGLQPVQIAA